MTLRSSLHPPLHRLDQRDVLASDLIVQFEQVLYPRLLHVRPEEIVEQAKRPAGTVRDHGPNREVGLAQRQVGLHRIEANGTVTVAILGSAIRRPLERQQPAQYDHAERCQNGQIAEAGCSHDTGV